MGDLTTDYTPVSQWATNSLVTKAGARAMSDSVRAVQEDMHDKLQYLKDGKNVETVLRSFGLADMVFDASRWSINHAQGSVDQVDHTLSDQYVYVKLVVPDLCLITSLQACIDPAAHGGAPAVMPNIALCRSLLGAGFGAMSVVNNQSDATAHPAYDSAHTFTLDLTSSPHTVERGNRYAYFARFTGESGAGAVDALKFYGVVVGFTTQFRDGGAG